jgi:hypothetical protein
VSFCLFISSSNKQTPSPISILEATPKLWLVPSVDQTIASGVVDQMATTDKKTSMTGIAKLKVLDFVQTVVWQALAGSMD